MREIRLNGALGAKFGRRHRFDVRSPAEAFRALAANYPDFQRELIASGRLGVGYRVKVDGDFVSDDDLDVPMSRSMSITPVVTGSGPIGTAIMAAVSIVSKFAIAHPIIFRVVSTLAIAGVSKLLVPSVSTSKDKARVEGDYFTGAINLTNQGGPVGVGYGLCLVGSTVISAAVTVEDKPLPTTPENVPIGGMFGDASGGLMS